MFLKLSSRRPQEFTMNKWIGAAANHSGKRSGVLTQSSSHFGGFWRLRGNTWPSHFTSFLFRAYRISPVLPSIPEKLAGKLNAKCRKSSKFYTELESLYVSVSSLTPSLPPSLLLPPTCPKACVRPNFPAVQKSCPLSREFRHPFPEPFRSCQSVYTEPSIKTAPKDSDDRICLGFRRPKFILGEHARVRVGYKQICTRALSAGESPPFISPILTWHVLWY